MSTAAYIYCSTCQKQKRPFGRSVPVEMESSLCSEACQGYKEDPQSDCRWPGEEVCGPGCTRGKVTIVCSTANLHPYECGGINENCPHCRGDKTLDHDPVVCALCHWNEV